MRATAADRCAAGKLRREIFTTAGVEPGTRLRAADVPRYEMAARAAGVLHQRARYEMARSVAFPAMIQREASPGSRMVDWNGEQRYYFEGVASTTDTPYEMYDSSGPYNEVITHDAFSETLRNNPDVAFLLNHRGMTMARTKYDGAGTSIGSLKLGMVEKGLGVEAWLNRKRTDINDMLIGLDDGEMTEMSFAFMLDEGEWSEDFETFTITKVDIDRGDVSVVNYGANPYTSVGARQQEIMAALRRLPTGAARTAQQILSSRSDVAMLESRLNAVNVLHEAAVAEVVESRGDDTSANVDQSSSLSVLRARLSLAFPDKRA